MQNRCHKKSLASHPNIHYPPTCNKGSNMSRNRKDASIGSSRIYQISTRRKRVIHSCDRKTIGGELADSEEIRRSIELESKGKKRTKRYPVLGPYLDISMHGWRRIGEKRKNNAILRSEYMSARVMSAALPAGFVL